MKEFKFKYGGHTFKRISEKQARAAFNNNLFVLAVPAGVHPMILDIMKIKTLGKYYGCDDTFDIMKADAVQWYARAGAAVSLDYYIPVKTVDIFTDDTPDADTLNTIERYDYTFGASKNA